MIIESENLVKNPLVSVIIATYNQISFIEETVMSALNQKCSFPFEIMVADDGSNDGERELLVKLQKQYPMQLKLIFNDKNMRVTKNYVNAIHNAKGKYIATLDGDDVWIATNKLEKQVAILEANNEVSIVYTGYQSYDNETGKIISRVLNWDTPCLRTKGKESASVFINGNYSYPLGSSACFRKDIYIKGCGDYPQLIENNVGEGTILNISMSMNGYFRFINQPMVKYRVLPSSLCHFESSQELINFRFNYVELRLLAANILSISPNGLVEVSSKQLFNEAISLGEWELYCQRMRSLVDKHQYDSLKNVYSKYCSRSSYLWGKPKVYVNLLYSKIKREIVKRLKRK